MTTGIYSDYSVDGVFRATGEINADALLEEWFRDHPDQNKAYGFDERAFLAWVSRKGLIEAIDSFEWHLANYGSPGEMHIDDNSIAQPNS